MSRIARKALALFTAAALLLQGCASAGQAGNAGNAPLSAEGPCNPALAAAIGGLLGALIAEDERAKGAAIGAGLGALACAMVNAYSRQTKPADEVEGQYRADHGGQLPAQPVARGYRTAFAPFGAVRAGDEATVLSRIEVVQGSAEPVAEVTEVLTLFDPQKPDEPLLRAEQVVSRNPRSGGFESSFVVRLPQRLRPGDYPARTELLINGRRAAENRGSVTVSGSGRPI